MRRILVLFIPFGFYLSTLCPNLYWGDSGEFIANSYVLGIPHSPGYPLYILTGKLFALIPLGSIGFRVNLVSAFFGALTVFLVYLITLKVLNLIASDDEGVEGISGIRPSFMGGIFSAFVVAFSYSHWSQSVVAEVYTLNAFLFSLMLYIFLISWKRKPSPSTAHDNRNISNSSNIFLLSFIVGVGFSNHQSIILSTPIFLLFFLLANRHSFFEPRRVFLTSVFFLLGISIYIYLPIRSMQNPPLNWGNPQYLSNFIEVFLRRDYGGLNPSNLSWEGILYTLGTFDPLYEFTIPLICILAFGLTWFLKKKERQPLFLFLSGLFIINLLGMATIMVTNLEPWAFTRIPLIGKFFLIPYMIFALWCGIGFYAVYEGISQARSSRIRYAYPGRYLILILGVALIANLILGHYRDNDKSRHYYANNFGQYLLKSIKQVGVIFSINDNYINALDYFQNVGARRPDIVHINRAGLKQIDYLHQIRKDYPQLNVPLKKTSGTSLKNTFIKEVVEKYSQSYPLYWVPHNDNKKVSKRLVSEGVIFRVSDETGVDAAREREFENRLIRFYNSEARKEDPSYLDDYTIRAYSEIFLRLGLHYFEKGMFRKAVEEFKRVVIINPFFEGGHNNLGISLAKLGRRDLARRELQEAISINPLSPKVNSNMAIYHMQGGNFDEAIRYFNRSLKLKPQNPEAYNDQGYCYVQKGLFSEARMAWEKALKINPNFIEVQRNLRHLTELGY